MRTSVFKGAIFTVGLRWTDRLIGFVSTLILARLLMPDDFGVVAMASMVILLADVFLNLGVNVALIQNQNATQEHYNTAWTLRIIQTISSCVLVSIFAPFAGRYFNDHRVVLVIQIISLHLVLNGFENIGIINFQKQMQFGLDFKFRISKRLCGFFVTMIAAWYLRSYWALVVGTLVGSSSGVLLSYVMNPMRPRFSLACWRQIFSVSQWMLVNSIGTYLNNNLHKIVVGRVASTSVMGGYTLADEIALMPAGELLSPINRVLFPAFASVKHDFSELKRLFLMAQGVQTLIAIPASVGLMLVAHEAVFVLLGAKWLFAVPFLQILVLANIFQAITTSGSYVVITLGYFRNAAFVTWLQVFVFLVLFLSFFAESANSVALIRIASIGCGFSLVIALVMRSLPGLRLGEVFLTVYRPILSAAVMYFALSFCLDVSSISEQMSLVIKIICGVVIYIACVMLLWYLAGKPESAERYLIQKFARIKSNQN